MPGTSVVPGPVTRNVDSLIVEESIASLKVITNLRLSGISTAALAGTVALIKVESTADVIWAGAPSSSLPKKHPVIKPPVTNNIKHTIKNFFIKLSLLL